MPSGAHKQFKNVGRNENGVSLWFNFIGCVSLLKTPKSFFSLSSLKCILDAQPDEASLEKKNQLKWAEKSKLIIIEK